MPVPRTVFSPIPLYIFTDTALRCCEVGKDRGESVVAVKEMGSWMMGEEGGHVEFWEIE